MDIGDTHSLLGGMQTGAAAVDVQHSPLGHMPRGLAVCYRDTCSSMFTVMLTRAEELE